MRFALHAGIVAQDNAPVAAERDTMIAKVVNRRPAGFDETREKLDYWLSRTVEERLAHVEELRREYWGQDYENQFRLPRSPEAVKRV